LSDDGQVFFSTVEALVPEDANGVSDTYEYDGASGELTLLSTGKGKDPAMFADASASGDDVFVLTRQQLASSDSDDLVDLYDVRVGPGSPRPENRDKAPCEGEGCQPLPAAVPAEEALGSVAVQASPPVSGEKVLVVAKRAAFRGVSGSLNVRLLAPGTLRWRGSGLRSGSVHRRGAGAARLALRLTSRARAQLRRHGRYQTTVHVTLVGSDGVRVAGAARVTFRVTAKKKGR
jgi:hypothetical protein